MNNRDAMKDMWDDIDKMHQEVKVMAAEIKKWQIDYGWGDWEPHTVGIIPMRINGRWYFKGDTVYRKEKMRYLRGSSQYKYGDEFDVLKDEYDNV